MSCACSIPRCLKSLPSSRYLLYVKYHPAHGIQWWHHGLTIVFKQIALRAEDEAAKSKEPKPSKKEAKKAERALKNKELKQSAEDLKGLCADTPDLTVTI